MKTQQTLRDIVSIMIIALGIFFIANGFIWNLLTNYVETVSFNWSFDKSFSSLGVLDALFLLFQLISLIASIAISFCRLFRVQFKEYKTERVIATVYLCLACKTKVNGGDNPFSLVLFELNPKQTAKADGDRGYKTD